MRSLLAALVLVAGCSSSGEKLPLKQGDYFVYRNVGSSSDRIEFFDEYRIVSVSGGEIKIQRIAITVRDGARTKKPGLLYTLGLDGRIKNTSAHDDAAFKGLDLKRLIQLWLPKKSRAIGKRVDFAGTLRKYRITGKKTVNERQVWVATHGTDTLRFDVKTGYLVGGIRGGRNNELVESSRPLMRTPGG